MRNMDAVTELWAYNSTSPFGWLMGKTAGQGDKQYHYNTPTLLAIAQPRLTVDKPENNILPQEMLLFLGSLMEQTCPNRQDQKK